MVRDQNRWRDYVLQGLVQPNIERDILAMTRVDKPALLKRLFELGAEYSGQILSYNKMLGQLTDAGNTTTLARYLDLLASAGLPNHSNQPHRRRGSSPKLNVLNTALMTAGSGYAFDEARADRTFWGRVVESAVGAHLYNTEASDIGLQYCGRISTRLTSSCSGVAGWWPSTSRVARSVGTPLVWRSSRSSSVPSAPSWWKRMESPSTSS